ncbi:hypothetical protein AB4512_21200, partial [Vibrio sp. 10N.222.52.B7]
KLVETSLHATPYSIWVFHDLALCQMASKKINSLPIPNQGPEKSVAQLEREIRQLKKKLEMAELENDFLKEAKAFFDSQKE